MAETVLSYVKTLIGRQSMLDHTFYQDWIAGRLNLRDLSYYAEQWVHMEKNLTSFLSGIIQQCPFPEVRKVIQENLDDESGKTCPSGTSHLELWKQFAREVDANINSLPSPNRWTSYTLETFKTLCEESGWKAGVVAFYTYESQNPKVCGQKIESLQRHYKVCSEDGLQFFHLHEKIDPGHDAALSGILEEHFSPSDKLQAVSVAERALSALNNFLDGVNFARSLHAIPAEAV